MNEHNWSHTLLLFPEPLAVVGSPSLEDRMQHMLSTFTETQELARKNFESISARMDSLELLMREIRGAIGEHRK